MTDTLLGFDAWGWLLIDLSWKAMALLLVAVGIERIGLRRRPLAADAVWSAALLVLILLPLFSVFSPVKFDWRISLSASHGAATLEPMTTEPLDRGISADDRPTGAQPHGGSTAMGGPDDSGHTTALARAMVNPALAALATVTYLAVAMLLALRLATGYLLATRLAGRARSLDSQRWISRLAIHRQALGIRRTVSLCLSDQVLVPATVGWRRPHVLLPPDLEHLTDHQTIDAILLHELVHIARRDYPNQIGWKLCQCLYWWNPLIWYAARRAAEIREVISDGYCVSTLGAREAYIGLLLDTAKRLIARRSPPFAVAMARTPRLERRLEFLRSVRVAAPRARGHLRFVMTAIGSMLLVIASVVHGVEPPAARAREKDAAAASTDLPADPASKLAEPGTSTPENREATVGATDNEILLAQESLRKRIDPLVQPYLDNNIIVGMTIGVLQQGRQVILGYGRMSEADDRVPDRDTIYEIGSTTKVFTGLLLADAVVRDNVKLDEPAGELLPPGVKMPAHGDRAITLQDLATHVSGLPRLPDNMKMADPDNPYADYTVEQLHEFLNQHQLDRAPGEKFEYSNLGMGLLGHLLSLQQHTTYEHLLRDRITTPLQMASTTITLTAEQKTRLAAPHTADGKLASNWDLPTLAGAGAIRSTAGDLLRLAEANLAPPAGELGQALELAWKIHQKPLAKGEFAMGLGWHVARDGSTRWHNGQTGGYHSTLFVNRKSRSSVVLLTNTGTSEVDPLAEDIMRMTAGATIEPRKFEKSLAVPPQVLQRYVGKFQLAPGFVFTVTVQDDKLMVGLSGQPTFQVYARSETEWFYKVVEATLTFKVDDNGKCDSLELFQNGARQQATRIK